MTPDAGRADLAPYLARPSRLGPLSEALPLAGDPARQPARTVDFIVDLNARSQQRDRLCDPHGAGRADAGGDARPRPGLVPRLGWLLVQMLRHLGFAARFVSGYLIQLKPT
jgi:hypothetical protein